MCQIHTKQSRIKLRSNWCQAKLNISNKVKSVPAKVKSMTKKVNSMPNKVKSMTKKVNSMPKKKKSNVSNKVKYMLSMSNLRQERSICTKQGQIYSQKNLICAKKDQICIKRCWNYAKQNQICPRSNICHQGQTCAK